MHEINEWCYSNWLLAVQSCFEFSSFSKLSLKTYFGFIIRSYGTELSLQHVCRFTAKHTQSITREHRFSAKM